MRLSEFMDMGGETFELERGGEIMKVEGIRKHDEREVLFEPGTDVKPGDWLIVDSGHRFYVRESDVQMYNRQPFALQAFYQTVAEYEVAQSPAEPQAPTFNIFGPTYSSNIGTQQNAQILQPTFTFGDLEQEIDRRGGEDAEALKEMMSQIRVTLEDQDSLSRGRLLGWSDLLNRHAWITGPIAQLLLIYATTGHIG